MATKAYALSRARTASINRAVEVLESQPAPVDERQYARDMVAYYNRALLKLQRYRDSYDGEDTPLLPTDMSADSFRDYHALKPCYFSPPAVSLEPFAVSNEVKDVLGYTDYDQDFGNDEIDCLDLGGPEDDLLLWTYLANTLWLLISLIPVLLATAVLCLEGFAFLGSPPPSMEQFIYVYTIPAIIICSAFLLNIIICCCVDMDFEEALDCVFRSTGKVLCTLMVLGFVEVLLFHSLQWEAWVTAAKQLMFASVKDGNGEEMREIVRAAIAI